MTHKLLSQRLKPFGFSDLYKKERILDLSPDQRSVLHSFLFVSFCCLLSTLIWGFSFPVLIVFYVSHMLSKFIFGGPPIAKKEGFLQSKMSNKIYPELHHFFFCFAFVIFLTLSSFLLFWATNKAWESFVLSLTAAYILSRGVLIACNIPLVGPILIALMPYLNNHSPFPKPSNYNNPFHPFSPFNSIKPFNRRDL